MAGFTGIRGDFSKLTRTIQGLQKLQTDWRKELARTLADTAKAEVLRQFRDQVDPYGKAWAPLAASTIAGRRTRRPRGFIGPLAGPKILENSGRLRRSFKARGEADGIRISTNVIYAGVHQHGHTFQASSNMGQRLMVFKNGRFAKLGSSVGKGFTKGSGYKFKMARQVFGERVIPQRQMVPEGAAGPRWSAAFTRDTRAFFQAKFARGLNP